MKIINYSFIIPHKNCPELLKRCVDSIPERNDVQIIIVDDNSDPDKKPSVQKKDVEIILLNKEQSNGAGKARNVGLERAIGKWLLFADADDYFSDYLPILLDKYVNDINTDIVYLNACQFDENGNVSEYQTEKLIGDYLRKKHYSEMNLRYSLWTPWTRMVKLDLVKEHSLRFDELPAGNDAIFCLNCSKYSKIINAENDIVYKYYKPSNGSSTDKSRLKMYHSRMDLRGRIITLQNEVGYRYHSVFIGDYLTFVKKRQMSFSQAAKEYFYYLDKYKISMFSDMWGLINKHILR